MSGRSSYQRIPKKVAESLTSYGKGTQSSRNKKPPVEQLQDRIRKFDTTEKLPADLSMVEITPSEAKVAGKRLLGDSIAQQAKRYSEFNNLSHPRRKMSKKKKVVILKKKIKRERAETPEPPPIRPIVKTRKIKSSKKGGGDVMDVQTFAEMELSGDMERKFRERMRRLNRQPDDVYTRLPDQESDFSFVAEVKTRQLMYAQVASMIESNKEIPALPIVSKVRMRNLLRAPIARKSERQCVYKEKCECFQEHGFICREMISETLEDAIMETLSNGGEVESILPPYIDMCVVCNMRITTELYDKEKAGLNSENPCIIHNFKIIVDTEGEYPSEMTLLGDDEFCGVIAPFLRSGVSLGGYPGRLYPINPYKAAISTTIVVCVEEALLRRIQRGKNYKVACQAIFQTSVEESQEWFVYGGHFSNRSVAEVIEYGLPDINLTFRKDLFDMRGEFKGRYTFESFKWVPKHLEEFAHLPASKYSWLLTLYLRINGAAKIADSFKEVAKREQALGEKLKRFINNHIPMATIINDAPLDMYEDQFILNNRGKDGTPFVESYVPLGPSRYQDDIMLTTRTLTLVPMAETPTEVFRRTFVDLGLGFSVLLKDDPLEETICRIRTMSSRHLEKRYIKESPLVNYLPFKPKTTSDIRERSVYMACMLILQEIDDIAEKVGEDSDLDPELASCVMFSLQKYKVAFVPLVFFMLNVRDTIVENGSKDIRVADAQTNSHRTTPLQMMYPWPTTGFYCGDLPNLNHTLSFIALWGTQNIKDKVPIVRTLIKSLPFCCQRRKLIENINENCREASYWRVFKRLFWCTLAGLYPWSKNRPDMCGLLRIYYLCENKDKMMNALKKESEINKGLAKGDKTNHTCHIVFTVFREYFLYLAEQNPGYVKIASQRIKWDEFRIQTIGLSNELRRSARLEHAPVDDPFRYARPALEKIGGSSKTNVYRFRKYPFPETIEEATNKIVDSIYVARRVIKKHKSILDEEAGRPIPDIEILNRVPLFANGTEDVETVATGIQMALEECIKHKKMFNFELDQEIKINIINYAIRLMPDERLKFAALTAPELGGISMLAVYVLHKCKAIYDVRSAPKDHKAQLLSITIHDLRVINWYFNVITKIGRLRLIPLDVDIVDSVAHAMRTVRYCLHPKEPLSDNVYRVFYSLCCGKVKSLPVGLLPGKRTQRKFGTIEVSYDPPTQNYVCVKKVKKTPSSSKASKVTTGPVHDKQVKKAMSKEATKERKKDNTLPCKGQPVIPIDIYGHALEVRSPDGKKVTRIQHCPSCATLHVYKQEYWGAEGYLCPYCTETSLTLTDIQRCTSCQIMNKSAKTEMRMVDVTRHMRDPHDPEWDMYAYPLSAYECLYFCKKHWYRAMRDAGARDMSKEFLIPDVKAASQRRRMHNLIKFNL